MSIIARHTVSRVRASTRRPSGLVLDGAGQTGKTTLVREILGFPATFTFDDPADFFAVEGPPLLLDAAYAPKSAYYAVRDALAELAR